MLETGDVLRTWALEELPRSWAEWRQRTAERFPHSAAVAKDDDVVAAPLGDHRREYLEFEGEVSGGRGSVTRVAGGEYEIAETETAWLVALYEGGVTRQIQLK
jgi:hypothetical protein